MSASGRSIVEESGETAFSISVCLLASSTLFASASIAALTFAASSSAFFSSALSFLACNLFSSASCLALRAASADWALLLTMFEVRVKQIDGACNNDASKLVGFFL